MRWWWLVLVGCGEGDASPVVLQSNQSIELLPPIDSPDAICVQLKFDWKTTGGGTLHLIIDEQDDGRFEIDNTYPTNESGQTDTYSLRTSALFDGLRVVLRNDGGGTLEIDHMTLEQVGDDACANALVGEIGPRAPGASCSDVITCETGLCVPGPGIHPWTTAVCQGCDATPGLSTCGMFQTCSGSVATSPILSSFSTCVTPRSIGQRCASGTDCDSQHCAAATLHTCTDGRACAADDDCPYVDDDAHGACAPVSAMTCQ